MNQTRPGQRAKSCLLVLCGLPASGKTLLSGMISAQFGRLASELGMQDSPAARMASNVKKQLSAHSETKCQVVSFDDYEAGERQGQHV